VCSTLESTKMSNSAKSLRFKTSSGMVYERRGSGRSLVFIHGWCLNRKMWLYAEEVLSREYEVITVDLPGFGLSDDLAGPFSLHRYSQEIATLIEEADISDAILIGFALGAMVALEACVSNPGIAAGVVSIAIPGGRYSPYDKMANLMRRDWPEFASRSAKALFHSPQSEATLRWISDLFGQSSLSTGLEVLNVLATYEPKDVAPKVGCPTLYLHAANDAVSPIEIGSDCEKASPFGSLSVIPDCGHLIVLDQKARFHEAVKHFADSLWSKNEKDEEIIRK